MLEVRPEQGSSLEPLVVEASGNDHARHMRNFLECIKSRETPQSDVELCHRSTSTAILGNIAYRTRRRITWDGAEEKIVGDEDASKLLWNPYHGSWSI